MFRSIVMTVLLSFCILSPLKAHIVPPGEEKCSRCMQRCIDCFSFRLTSSFGLHDTRINSAITNFMLEQQGGQTTVHNAYMTLSLCEEIWLQPKSTYDQLSSHIRVKMKNEKALDEVVKAIASISTDREVPALTADPLQVIFSFVNPQDLGKCRKVSRFWRLNAEKAIRRRTIILYQNLDVADHFKMIMKYFLSPNLLSETENVMLLKKLSWVPPTRARQEKLLLEHEATTGSPDLLARLPREVIVNICSYLPDDSILAMAQTNRKWREDAQVSIIQRLSRIRGVIKAAKYHQSIRGDLSVIGNLIFQSKVSDAVDFLSEAARKLNSKNSLIDSRSLQASSEIILLTEAERRVSIEQATQVSMHKASIEDINE
jgi:hypothetical protein